MVEDTKRLWEKSDWGTGEISGRNGSSVQGARSARGSRDLLQTTPCCCFRGRSSAIIDTVQNTEYAGDVSRKLHPWTLWTTVSHFPRHHWLDPSKGLR